MFSSQVAESWNWSWIVGVLGGQLMVEDLVAVLSRVHWSKVVLAWNVEKED